MLMAAGTGCVEFSAAHGLDIGLQVQINLEEAFHLLDAGSGLHARKPARIGRAGSATMVGPRVPHCFPTPNASPACCWLNSPPGHNRYVIEPTEPVARSGPPNSEAIATQSARYDTGQLSSQTASAERAV